jgi:hypothetical protein
MADSPAEEPAASLLVFISRRTFCAGSGVLPEVGLQAAQLRCRPTPVQRHIAIRSGVGDDRLRKFLPVA